MKTKNKRNSPSWISGKDWNVADWQRLTREQSQIRANKRLNRQPSSKSAVSKTSAVSKAVVARTKSQLAALRADNARLEKQVHELQELAKRRLARKQKRGLVSKVSFTAAINTPKRRIA